ncbi:MAG: hypothetical protein K5920_12075 [Bacteroidales bacterium]|nr:hypothetical protein [Bacteroidales bacterium]
MATMGEIMKDPSKATEEDVKALKGIYHTINSLKEKLSPFEGIKEDSGRTINELAKSFYQENLILSAVLEAFAYQNKYSFANLNKWVFNYVDNDFIWGVSIPNYYRCVAKLCNIGLLKAEFKDEGDNNPFITITDQGIEALRQQTYANLAQSALFNYQASKLNEQSVKMNEQSVELNKTIKRLTVASVAVAFAALLVAVVALFR